MPLQQKIYQFRYAQQILYSLPQLHFLNIHNQQHEIRQMVRNEAKITIKGRKDRQIIMKTIHASTQHHEISFLFSYIQISIFSALCLILLFLIGQYMFSHYNHKLIVETMIGNLKLKVRAPVKEETAPSRRIKTDMNQNGKKISLYVNKTRAPLAQNRRIFNENQTLTLKKQKPIKSIALKNPTNCTKLNTEVKDQDQLTHAQRIAANRIFAKKDNSHSLNKRDQRQGKETSRMVGANRYAFEDKVGSGTFGIVHKARDKKTLELVAIKRVYQDKKYKNRELEILKGLNHPNVLRIRDSFFTYQGDKEYLNVVMDFFPSNLFEHIQKYRGKGEISRLKLKVFAYQLFRGLLYLSQESIAHRDIKPQNILVNDANWNLIICDFGSAKKLQEGQPNLAYICSRCYRAPQLIFASTGYSPQIDMWSAGCILVEMLTLQPIFRSDSNIDQLVEIIKVLGTPSYDEIMEMNPDCDIDKYQFPKINPRPWQKILKKKAYGQEFYDLLYKVMRYSPHRRATPTEALLHPFFDELRDEQVYSRLKKEYQIADLFDFSPRQLSEGDAYKLMPKWHS